MTASEPVPAHSPHIVTRKTGGEYILVPVVDNIADMDNFYVLNESGAFIWELIDGSRNISEITRAVMEEFDVDDNRARADVISFITNLKEYLILKE